MPGVMLNTHCVLNMQPKFPIMIKRSISLNMIEFVPLPTVFESPSVEKCEKSNTNLDLKVMIDVMPEEWDFRRDLNPPKSEKEQPRNLVEIASTPKGDYVYKTSFFLLFTVHWEFHVSEMLRKLLSLVPNFSRVMGIKRASLDMEGCGMVKAAWPSTLEKGKF